MARSNTEVNAEAYSEMLIESVRTNMVEMTTLSNEKKPTLGHCLKERVQISKTPKLLDLMRVK